jgi:hypothetical protein
MAVAIETEGRAPTGTTETATTGLEITAEITAEKETGTDECTGMFQEACKTAYLAGGIQSSVMVLTEFSSREGVGGRLVRMLKEF